MVMSPGLTPLKLLKIIRRLFLKQTKKNKDKKLTCSDIVDNVHVVCICVWLGMHKRRLGPKILVKLKSDFSTRFANNFLLNKILLKHIKQNEM